ncbi:hypothetical protein [Rhizobium sp. L1K21]|uniref:hypothetical protein n=1 Tax=Rhizobium sp. L1K21 TaxID=2954933 RepID=UPI0020929D2B|nr:hypothetical protein [Rhizobium sp. L1K21]MCO6185345.1 hypothetical protein [Rhizobium sp. L1K21]
MKDSDDRRFDSGQPLFRLHDMAAQRGDGLIPQLRDLFMGEIERRPTGDNIVVFPAVERDTSLKFPDAAEVVDLTARRVKD